MLPHDETRRLLSHWRHDPLTQRQVRIAPGRDLRPSDLDPSDSHTLARCPFCRGAEADTPEELGRVEDAAQQWLARAVPNRYPAVELPDGAHEVLVESPHHATHFAEIDLDTATAAVALWIDRVGHWQADPQIDYVLLFKNEGRAAGASLAHVHSQLTALAETPSEVQALWQRVVRLPERLPLAPPERQVGPIDELEVFSPEAPRSAYETWIASRTPLAQTDPRRLAGVLQRVVRLTTEAAATEGMNLVLQLPPRSLRQAVGEGWWIEVLPRTSPLAGFELATNWRINPIGPEEAAHALRRALGKRT